MTHDISACLAMSDRLKQSDTPRLDAELLLAHVLKKERSFLFAHADFKLDQAQLTAFSSLLSRREAGEPIAYLIGSQGFWTLDLEVNACTLIPRPETELLVELACDRAPSEETRILDLGTGTGAIALALAKEIKNADVLGVDFSSDVVGLAERNKAANHVKNVRFSQSDWFQSVEGLFDIIVSNPPYIDPDDKHLKMGDVRFEPRSALVAEENGFKDIRTIISQSRAHLYDDAVLLLEHGYDQAERVRLMFETAGFIDIETIQDLGRRDRVTLGVWPG